MRKVLICFLLLLICGCNNNYKSASTNNDDKEDITVEDKPVYVDNNPIVIGTYINKGNILTLSDEFISNWNSKIDIVSIEVYFTNDNVLNGTNQKELYHMYANSYSSIDNYKIGYNIKYSKGDTTINKNILSPSDTEEIFSDIQLYLYDDINNSGWYSHVTSEEYNDNTILSSIKLTNSTYTNDITSDIVLTAFTYDSDDFDEDGNYRGISKYLITIKRG